MENTAIEKTNGNALATTQKKMPTLKEFFEQDNVKGKFQELLGKRSQGFITSVLQIVTNNDMLKKADQMSIYNSAAVAAILDLPLNNNLGFAYIVPYNQSYQDEQGTWKKKQVAQFQLGYKGFIQLAQRSGQFKTIASTPIYEGQLIEENPLTGFVFDFTKKKSETVIGYAAYFALINGFEKVFYMTVAELKKHGKSFSQTFKNDKGLWKDNFDAMANKTVIKLLLSKYAPLSIEMQRAIITDQAVINNAETQDVSYVDNTDDMPDKEAERVVLLLNDAKTIEDVEALQEQMPETDEALFIKRKTEINPHWMAEPVEEPEKVSDELKHDITVCETIPQLNELWKTNHKLQANGEFNTLINKRKIQIGKDIKAGRVSQ